MLRTAEQKRFSEYTGLFDIVVHKNHLLRKLKELVDFNFVIEELKSKYCSDNGRDAVCPIRLFKYVLLKMIYPLSDRDLVERSISDMSFKFFLDYNPEDNVIHPSLLTYFRKIRLQDEELLDKLVRKSVEIAISHGLIKSKRIILDSTHTTSVFKNHTPQEILQDLAKKLRKSVYAIDESLREKFPPKTTGKEIVEHIDYCKSLLGVIDSEDWLLSYPSVSESAEYLREVVNDNLEHLQQSKDKEAKVGHKTKDTSFFGFKSHMAMTEEGIITAAVVTSGEKHDGKQLPALVEKSREAGIEVEAVIGDGAYSEKDNIIYAKDNFELVSKLSSAVVSGFRKDEDKFAYNKDAGMFVCKAGHMAVSKTRRHNKQSERKENPREVHYFDVEKCKHCQMREGCYKEGSKSKSYSVSLGSYEHSEQLEFQQTERFKELSSNRYKIEAKNSELKNRLNCKKAYSTGIHSVTIQWAAAIFAANMKRIIKLMGV